MAADEFTWKASNGTTFSREPRVASVQYGDGYAQESPDGLNNNPLTCSLVIRNEDITVLRQIDDFLSARAGWQIFTWTAPQPHHDLQRRWKCKKWDWTYEGGRAVGITATFEEKFQ